MAKRNHILSDWISRDDLARELNVSPSTLATWATKRTGPPLIRVGRRVFYRRSTVARWLAEREKAGK